MFESRQTFHRDIDLIFSTVENGSMAAGAGSPSKPEHVQNVDRFLNDHNFPTDHSRIYVTYGDSHTYTEVVRVTNQNHPQTIESDAIYTTETGLVMTLPVADCVATVVYDPEVNMLGVLHLGRHASVAGLIESFTIEVADNVGSDPRDWYVWMSPSLRQPHDRMDYFLPADTDEWRDFVDVRDDGTYIDVLGHNVSRFERAGVASKNIVVSPVDTYVDERFFSNRASTELRRPERQGRMMVAARIL